MNPLYQMLSGGPPAQAANAQQPMNPFQRINQMRQIMANPAAFVKQQFPDIPNEIMNDPNAILGYLQRTRGITNDQIQQIYNMHWRK